MDRLVDTSPYHRALILRGLSKCQEEEEVMLELVQVMEYARAISVQALEHTMDVDWRTIIAVEGLDLSVVDLETRVQAVEAHQGNVGGINSALAEMWGRAMNTSDAMDRMEVDVDDIKERLENVELVYMEVDQQVVQLEWELANSQQDVAMLVSERMRMGEQWEQLWDVVLQQTDLITELQGFMFLMNERLVAAQHGPGNLIMVEDDDNKEDRDPEDEVFDEDHVFFPPPGLAVAFDKYEGGVLWEIVENGPPEYEE